MPLQDGLVLGQDFIRALVDAEDGRLRIMAAFLTLVMLSQGLLMLEHRPRQRLSALKAFAMGRLDASSDGGVGSKASSSSCQGWNRAS